MNSKLFIILIASTILIAILTLLFFINQRESLLMDGKIQISNLQKPVKVYFDQLAIPYIEARSEKDLTIAQGFITASQRLFQMDILRRIAKGETAAVFGDNCLNNDKLAHIVGFKRIAEAEYPLLSPETKNWLKAYSLGVNTYISSGRLPLEFILLGYEPQIWQPEDSLTILKYLQYSSDECWQINLLQNAISQKAGESLAKQMFSSLCQSSSNMQHSSSLDNDVIDMKEKTKSVSFANTKHEQRGEQRPENSDLTSWQNNNNILPIYNLVNSFPQAARLSWGSHAWTISKELSQTGEPCYLVINILYSAFLIFSFYHHYERRFSM